MTLAAGAVVVDGRVEAWSYDGQALVVVTAGSFTRLVSCPPIGGLRVGDEVIVELQPSALLKSGTIVRLAPGAREPAEHRRRRRR